MANSAVTPTAPAREERCATLLDGAHGAVTIRVSTISQRSLETFYYHASVGGAVRVAYRGHKDDLAAADCLKLGLECYDRFLDDRHGGLWYLTSKAGPGKRGFIQVSYYACSAGFAATLPGVRGLFPEALAGKAVRPQLRLVVDNTREMDHV